MRKLVTCSDSAGYVYLPEGFDREKLAALLELKNVKRGRVKEFAEQFGCNMLRVNALGK